MSKDAPILTGKLRIKDETGSTLKKIGNKITRSFKNIAKIAAGVLTRDLVRGIINVGQESIILGGKIETLETSFEALRGPVEENGLTLERLSEAVRGTVSDIDLLTAANQAMALGLPKDELDELFTAAQSVGAAMGRTTLEAVRDLTTGIGRQSRLILDNLGIIVNTEHAYRVFAGTLGKTAAQLSDAERKTAFMNAAISSLNAKAKELGDNISDTQLSQEKFTASIKNAKTAIGQALIPILNDALGVFTNIIEIINELIATIKEGDWAGAVDVIASAFSGMTDAILTAIEEIDWDQVRDAFVRIAERIGEITWNAFINTIEGKVESLGEKILKGIPGSSARSGTAGIDILRGIGEGLSQLGITIPGLEAQEGLHGTLERDTTIRAHAGERVDITPAEGGVGGGGVTFQIGTFIGLNEESARMLAQSAAEEFIRELERQGVKL